MMTQLQQFLVVCVLLVSQFCALVVKVSVISVGWTMISCQEVVIRGIDLKAHCRRVSRLTRCDVHYLEFARTFPT